MLTFPSERLNPTRMSYFFITKNATQTSYLARMSDFFTSGIPKTFILLMSFYSVNAPFRGVVPVSRTTKKFLFLDPSISTAVNLFMYVFSVNTSSQLYLTRMSYIFITSRQLFCPISLSKYSHDGKCIDIRLQY